ncbi:hypothetical protein [Limnofasciculus baicalensis]|uniref:Uncharacterized protein n=1 Tax=Limnofasciculus baicalensis BBK-W-15 TaxID=2699891 RepID=A0AAE3GR50_9CYAN|nr:hypothetical protein [Limnofasciculus baicalensis]MCP2728333.1 hypothetical protein [Limnofasciculus baicalensis BBK-W-15]
MNTITITISDERLLKLQAIANQLNLSIEDLVFLGIENLITQPEAYQQKATQYLLNINTELDPEITNKFYTLASQWQSEVEGISSTAQMSQHPAYQEIISMGTKIVPLLLSELKQNPLYWLSALREITGSNPIKPEQRGRVKQMADAWLEWGKNQGYAI